VAEVGARSARLLLITDINSRTPVMLEASRTRAILTGDNSQRPRLNYITGSPTISVGDRVVTAASGGAFPPGIPRGGVVGDRRHRQVEPFVQRHRLNSSRWWITAWAASCRSRPPPPGAAAGEGGETLGLGEDGYLGPSSGPFGITVFLLLLTAIPPIPGFSGIAPMLPLMGSITGPSTARPAARLAGLHIGLLYDIVAARRGGERPGLLLVRGGGSQRKFFLGKSFAVTWWAFSLLTAGAIGMAWLLLSFIKGRPLDIAPVVFEYLMTLALFPLLTWTLARTQLAFLRDV
jgi:rod shape-determining protein MreD